MKPDLDRSFVQRVSLGGGLASLLSLAALAHGGRRDVGSALAPINAPSHWFWGDEALRRNGASAKYTLLGATTHHASSLFWAGVYELLGLRRRRRTAAGAVADAAVVTALAAVVDLRIVPERLTPGFERRLSKRSLAWVYVAFGAGLAIGGVLGADRDDR